MIKVERINIKEFRGIRDLTLCISGRNYAVCGPNGTGKSGIVDALEFGLTGNISRLTGKGRGELSVKEHAPHVNSRRKPENAIVTLDLLIVGSGKKVTISRSVKSPREPNISPDTPEARTAIAYAERHPEFALSRREIIKYVLAEPGVRAKEVQELLQLDKLETTRVLLQRISNAAARECKNLEAAKNIAASHLARALGVTELKQANILAVVNEKRAVLGLPALVSIEANTSIRDGLDSHFVSAVSKVPKLEAKRDINAGKVALGEMNAADMIAARARVVEDIRKLQEDEENLTGVSRDSMLKSALDFFDGTRCPVCLTSWNPIEFRSVVNAQRAQLEQAELMRVGIEKSLLPILDHMQLVSTIMKSINSYAHNFPTPITSDAIISLTEEISQRIEIIRKFLPIEDTIAAIQSEYRSLGDAIKMLDHLVDDVDFLPEPTKMDAARDYLTVGQERLVACREAADAHAGLTKKAQLAEKVHETFIDTCDKTLEKIYSDVEAEFRDFYKIINGEDEEQFKAQLTPSLGKLGFSVDFYGKGFFPPGAYHSEGHQDGMGLCLYLALMKHLQGPGFTFSVLDDVLMSVDSAHRREVCKLLKTVFQDTQFVLTTHDQVWLNHMRTSGLVESKNAIVFRKWHVDHGPSEWRHLDVWTEVLDLVGKNEIRAAASQLRHYLEYIAAEWSHRLEARVVYRADGRYELGDLLPSAIGAMNDLYKAAKAAAQSWGKKELLDEIKTLHANFSKSVTESQVEQWIINPAVHYNEWANFGRPDFEPVVRAFLVLEQEFACGKCAEPLYVVRSGHEREALRCGCMGVNFNLKLKSK